MNQTLPKELPNKPAGWRRRMVMHLNFVGGKASATFEVLDEKGNVTPIGYQYDTRKGGLTGFTLPGLDPVMSWDELRAIWPTFVERKEAEAKARA
jgi:hypothetical protein